MVRWFYQNPIDKGNIHIHLVARCEVRYRFLKNIKKKIQCDERKIRTFGGIAQLVEHSLDGFGLHTETVAGSSPASSTKRRGSCGGKPGK